ncbi:alpha/beta fold hydrolase [Methylobacterium sp. J-092]|uniref:alpha/beta fold hydrolase n=1 Tax=Methylobacterium sp. J-092 TaxID=2836667 RepID=UPI001FB91811|nr:alpha/beta hydrolase [Methylobacterium sp. J-092]MCJ2009917.1 alpha/beta hydrolase [Methylobacterium sp. J-092]
MAALLLDTSGLPGPPPETQRIVPRKMVDLPDGRSIAYAETGAGPDLVAIHGTLMTLEDMWLGPVPALARHFRVVAVDRPGHGRSTRARGTDASPWRQAELIHTAVRSLGLHRPVIVGHSYGGAVALAYGLLYPDDVAGIVALAPVCFPELRLEQVLFGPRAAPVSGPVLSRALGASADPTLLPMLWNAMFLPQTMPKAFAEAFPFGFAGRSGQIVAEAEDALSLWVALSRSATAYATCRVPVRILAGDADIVVNPMIHGALAARLIPGARYERLPGIGHMLHHFRADAVTEAARAVLPRS